MAQTGYIAGNNQAPFPSYSHPITPIGATHSAGLMVPASNATIVPIVRWATRLFECNIDDEGCCEGMWCFHCQLGRQHHMLKHNAPGLDVGTCASLMLLDWCTLGMASAAFAVYLRRQVRERYGIPGHHYEEGLQALFCKQCSTCQTYREMSAHGQWPGGIIAKKPFAVMNTILIPPTGGRIM